MSDLIDLWQLFAPLWDQGWKQVFLLIGLGLLITICLGWWGTDG